MQKPELGCRRVKSLGKMIRDIEPSTAASASSSVPASSKQKREEAGADLKGEPDEKKQAILPVASLSATTGEPAAGTPSLTEMPGFTTTSAAATPPAVPVVAAAEIAHTEVEADPIEQHENSNLGYLKRVHRGKSFGNFGHSQGTPAISTFVEMKRQNAINAAALKNQREFNAEVLSRIEAQQTQQNELIKLLSQSMKGQEPNANQQVLQQQAVNQGVAQASYDVGMATVRMAANAVGNLAAAAGTAPAAVPPLPVPAFLICPTTGRKLETKPELSKAHKIQLEKIAAKLRTKMGQQIRLGQTIAKHKADIAIAEKGDVPPGQRRYKPVDSHGELEWDYTEAKGVDKILTITIPKGSSRNSALACIHNQTQQFIRAIKLEGAVEQLAVRAKEVQPDEFRNRCVEHDDPDVAECRELKFPPGITPDLLPPIKVANAEKLAGKSKICTKVQWQNVLKIGGVIRKSRVKKKMNLLKRMQLRLLRIHVNSC